MTRHRRRPPVTIRKRGWWFLPWETACRHGAYATHATWADALRWGNVHANVHRHD